MLDAQEFLDRIIAPGGFLAFAFKHPDWGQMSHRFFPRDQIADAVNWLRYMGARLDVWHAVASYREAIPNGLDNFKRPKFKGRRRADNAEMVQCFFCDGDIKREGDGKKLEDCYADDNELAKWVFKVKRETGLPFPNLWIRSGYGVHLYWVLDQALPVVEWTPLAAAFKRLLIASGAKGDIGVSGDAARILRPPETFNHKVPDDRRPCFDITPERLRVPDTYPVATLRAVLQNYTTVVNSGGLGTPPPHIRDNNLGANARAGLSHAPRSFELIGKRCAQVGRSLDEGGEHDGRPLWHLMVNLAFFCGDRQWAHRIGDRHPKYTSEETDKKWDQTEDEHKHNKDFGAPACTSFDAARTGICQLCPHFGKITSPYSLGAEDLSISGLPTNYRASNGWIEHWVKDDWTRLVQGTFNNVALLRLGDAYELRFDYARGIHSSHVRANEKEVCTSIDGIRHQFIVQGISLNRFNAIPFGDFIMAWIDELRTACAYVDAPPAFGWTLDRDGGYAGLSVGGTFYAADGDESPAQLGDPKIWENYQPRGTLEAWQQAANFVLEGRSELQAIAAVAFAAPLMEFVGESGVLSVWSQFSGARKTSAFRIGTAVWCNPITGMSAIRDTTNSVQMSLTTTRIMPVYWDEIHAASKDQIAAMVELFFNLTQGRGRARLDQNLVQRDPGYWRTMMIVSSNKPMAELIEQDRGAGTDAGAIRLFEFEIEPRGQITAEASGIVQQVERHYGNAGRIYARWLARHTNQIKQTVELIKKRIFNDAEGVEASERYHFASVIAIVAGATFAKHCGLFKFDVEDIYQFLINSLKKQRVERREEIAAHDHEAYLLQTFEKFVADSTASTLVTQSFTRPGRRRAGLKQDSFVHVPGPRADRALIYVSIDDREMRIDGKALKDWCRTNRHSFKIISNQMIKLWGAELVRDILARNSQWSSGVQVNVFKVWLKIPQLQKYVYSWGTPTDTSDDNVVQFPNEGED